MNIKRYKIFLASSSELSQERKTIVESIHTLNRILTEEKGIILEPVFWEDLKLNFQGDARHTQDYINIVISECDILIVLFDKKIGQFTAEEFIIAT